MPRVLTLLLTLGLLLVAAPARAGATCALDSARGDIQRVIYVQFDDAHFRRDNPERALRPRADARAAQLHEEQGHLFTNDHTRLIAHTATGILMSLTGVYGDRMGVPVSNSFRYFNPNGTSSTGVSFAYWTDGIFDPATTTPTDTTFNMLTAEGSTRNRHAAVIVA